MRRRESYSSSDDSDRDLWIDNHLEKEENEFLCRVDMSYIEDNFNLYGLRDIVDDYKHSLLVILGREELLSDSEGEEDENASQLYGLIHQRYIITKRGLDVMMKKYRAHDFGKCTVHGCKSYLLPLGMSDRVGVDHVKVYCPSCRLAFSLPKDHECSGLDGAYFGRTFPHLLVMQYPDVFSHSPQPSAYVPRVFGFRVHDGNRQKSQEELVRENTSLRRQLRDLEAKLGVMKVEPHHRSSKRRSSSSKSSRSARDLQRDHKHTSSAVDAHKRQKTAGRTR